jgi:hypothetical protein
MASVMKRAVSPIESMDKSDDNDRIRPLSESELEWKHRINEKLLTVLDLSLLETIDESKARAEIREIALQLMIERSHGTGTPGAVARR